MGAVPMITFAKYHPPHDDPRNLRTYLARCADVVWGCLEQWGGERVRDWYWCVWNEPNNYHVGGALSFPQYRRIYEEVAHDGAPAAGALPGRAEARASAGRRCAGSRPTGSTGSPGSSTRLTRRSSASCRGTTTATGARWCRPPAVGFDLKGDPEAPHGPALPRAADGPDARSTRRARGRWPASSASATS